jgi:ribosomal-protein-alanine N-acetyltransferase
MRLHRSTDHDVFKPLHGRTINGKNIRLREKKLTDVRNDYTWQSDPELCRFDAVPVLNLPYAVYLLDYTNELKKKRRNRFPLAIETLDGRHIGNCTCYEIDEKKSETQLGIMIADPTYRDQGYGQEVVHTVVDYVFQTTSLDRIYLKTLDWNVRAQRCFARCGFTSCGELKRDGHSFVLMELDRQHWEKGWNGDKGE